MNAEALGTALDKVIAIDRASNGGFFRAGIEWRLGVVSLRSAANGVPMVQGLKRRHGFGTELITQRIAFEFLQRRHWLRGPIFTAIGGELLVPSARAAAVPRHRRDLSLRRHRRSSQFAWNSLVRRQSSSAPPSGLPCCSQST